jgi:hypothetical protein
MEIPVTAPFGYECPCYQAFSSYAPYEGQRETMVFQTDLCSLQVATPGSFKPEVKTGNDDLEIVKSITYESCCLPDCPAS